MFEHSWERQRDGTCSLTFLNSVLRWICLLQNFENLSNVGFIIKKIDEISNQAINYAIFWLANILDPL